MLRLDLFRKGALVSRGSFNATSHRHNLCSFINILFAKSEALRYSYKMKKIKQR